jgi:protein-tyrosine-phosphatase
MAEGMLRAKLPSDMAQRVAVRSAGTLGIFGQPATAFAIAAAREHGADLSGHRSQGLSQELVDWADLILVMERAHVRFIEEHFPEAVTRTHLLRAFRRAPQELAGDEEIPDPIGASLAVYRECAHLIAVELDRLVPLLSDLLEKKASAAKRTPS